MRAMVCGIVIATACATAACHGAGERGVCKHLAKLCGDDIIDDSCPSDLADLKDALGDSYGKMMACAHDAESCPEAAGCFAGGFGHAFDRWQKQFEHGMGKVMDDDSPPAALHTHADDKPSAYCTSFTSSELDARWDGCDDHVKRELQCKTFMDELECNCLEDGVEKWSFTAKDSAARHAR